MRASQPGARRGETKLVAAMASIGARLSACALGFATGSVASWKLLNDEIKRTTAVQVAALSAAVPAPPPPPPVIETPAPEPAPAESSSS